MTSSKKYYATLLIVFAVILITLFFITSSGFLNPKLSQTPSAEQVNIYLPPAIQTLRSYAAFQNLTGVENIRVISFKEVTWNDSCLEIHLKDETCTAIKVSGYEAVLASGKTLHTYHLNSDAGIIREVL